MIYSGCSQRQEKNYCLLHFKILQNLALNVNFLRQTDQGILFLLIQSIEHKKNELGLHCLVQCLILSKWMDQHRHKVTSPTHPPEEQSDGKCVSVSHANVWSIWRFLFLHSCPEITPEVTPRTAPARRPVDLLIGCRLTSANCCLASWKET